jgi:hypothetical protein
MFADKASQQCWQTVNGGNMKFQINEKDQGLAIEVNDLQGKQKALLATFQECQQGRCSCPTKEYKKLSTFSMEVGNDCVHLHLQARPGEHIDQSEIKRCLKFTEAKVNQSTE